MIRSLFCIDQDGEQDAPASFFGRNQFPSAARLGGSVALSVAGTTE